MLLKGASLDIQLFLIDQIDSEVLEITTKSMSNGVVIFDNLSIETEGTFIIKAACVLISNAEYITASFIINSKFLELSIENFVFYIQPYTTEDIFTAKVMVFKNEIYTDLYLAADLNIEILATPNQLNGIKITSSTNGKAIFSGLSFSAQGTFSLQAITSNILSNIITITIKNYYIRCIFYPNFVIII